MAEQRNNSFEMLFNTFFKPGEVAEIRVIGITGKGPWDGWAKGTVSGYFNDPVEFAKAAAVIDNLQKAEGIYFTLNPVNPALLARANNRLVAPKATTTDDQVICHRWLLIDTDPVRPSGISATAEEVETAIDCRNKVAGWLEKNGWPLPIKAFSSNGGHALYRLEDLPNTPEIADLKRKALQVINEKFGKNGVDVDVKVFNAARIVKLYGTWGRKGDSTEDRPHRQSFLEEVPTPLNPVSLNQPTRLAAQAQKTQSQTPRSKPQEHGRNLGPMSVGQYLTHYGIDHKIKERGDLTIHILMDGCLFDPSHTKGEASIIQNGNGLITYQCFHNSCKGRSWAEAREKISNNDNLAQFCEGYDPDRFRPRSCPTEVDEAVEERAAIQVESQEAEEQANHSLEFPSHVMSGVAGDFARIYGEHMESPDRFFYMSYLTMFGLYVSDRLFLHSQRKPQPRLYTILLGESGDTRKSTAMEETEQHFREFVDPTAMVICRGAASGEGLGKLIAKVPKALIYYDELKVFVSKAGIQQSSLLPAVNTLFESNRYENHTSKDPFVVENGFVAMLAASTVDTYAGLFDAKFLDIGFNNRLFLVPGDSDKCFPIPKAIPDETKRRLHDQLRNRLKLINGISGIPIDEDASECWTQVYRKLKGSSPYAKRLDTYGLRLMPLLAVNDLKRTVDLETVNKVIALIEWQYHVREIYDPIDAEGQVARMEETLRRKLRARGSWKKRELQKSVHYERSGLWVWESATKNLIKNKELNYNAKQAIYSRG
ncbi:MAG: DUF3987 domain-containing protein [Deltaproteobacteria bacterium]|nr:DUF3987 domain-containing protein [Deltaproteobacteria bacterium]